jgi:hypothetical protein
LLVTFALDAKLDLRKYTGSKEVQLLSTDIVLMLGRWVRVVDLVLNPDDPVVESVELLLLDPGRLTTPPSTIPVDAL